MTVNKNFLKIPLYKLYYIDNVNDFSGLDNDELDSLKSEYGASELKGIIESIKWAKKNPCYDFACLLPNMKHDNSDIYKYLCKLEGSLNSSKIEAK